MSSIKIDQSGAQAGGHIVAGDLSIHYPTPSSRTHAFGKRLRRLGSAAGLPSMTASGKPGFWRDGFTEGVLAGGSDEVRGRALAWCARIPRGLRLRGRG